MVLSVPTCRVASLFEVFASLHIFLAVELAPGIALVQSPTRSSPLTNAIGRIEAFGRSHEAFELADAGIPMRPYLEGLCASLSAQAVGGGSISVKVVAEDIILVPKHASTIDLIANELLTNAYKHAFESGTAVNIAVNLHRSKTRLTLAVEDDGKGCPEDAQAGVGSQLIRLLVAQLEGEVMRQSIQKAVA
jgi:two-component sensor histidine kinase